MKHIQELFLLIFLLGFFSCAQEEQGEVTSGTNALRLMISANGMGVNSKVQEPGTNEDNSVSDLYIYCFNSAENQLLFQHVYGTNQMPFSVELSENFPTGEDLVLYVFASTNGTKMPGLGAKVPEFSKLQTSGMGQYGGSGVAGRLLYPPECMIPMVSKALHSASSTEHVKVVLERCIAKLRVRVVNRINTAEGITLYPDEIKMQVKNVRSLAGYLESNSEYADSPALFTSQWIDMADHNETANSEKWVYCYLNEHDFNLQTLPGDRMSLLLNIPYSIRGGAKATYSYGVPMDFVLQRNYIYQLTVNIHSAGAPGRAVSNDEGLATRINTSWDVKQWGE